MKEGKTYSVYIQTFIGYGFNSTYWWPFFFNMHKNWANNIQKIKGMDASGSWTAHAYFFKISSIKGTRSEREREREKLHKLSQTNMLHLSTTQKIEKESHSKIISVNRDKDKTKVGEGPNNRNIDSDDIIQTKPNLWRDYKQ